MPLSGLAFFGLILLLLSTAVDSHVHIHGRDLNQPLLDSYDYIVVGCGISGLVVTNRLSELTDRTVLCIEAGIPDHYEAFIQDPVSVGSDLGGIYDWDLTTVPQYQLDGASRPMPQGKVLGGGSILNAMCWNRGGGDDYDAWEALGNPGWGWEGLLPYFRKSETYTPVYSEAVAQEYSINYNPAVHGTNGPVQVSYPKYFYPQSVNLFDAMNILGLPTQFDPNDGTSAGPALIPTDIDPNNQTRSDARRTYYDPYVSRTNFHVITGQHVTRVIIEGVANNSDVSNPTTAGDLTGNGPSSGNNEGFGFGPGGSTGAVQGQTAPGVAKRQDPGSSSLRVTGVEFAANATAARQVVYATREVIVAAGALHSAQLLQLSGIGPSALLSEFNIPLALDLPGVGNNLQDHCLVGTFYPYNNASYPSPTELTANATYSAEAEEQFNLYKTGPWTAGSPNALAFNPLPLISNRSDAILGNASNQDPAMYLPVGIDATIVAGYTAQKQSLVQRLGQNHVASYEIINNNAGSLTVSVMHPLSRGTCYITSADPFQPPAIDPRWLTNPTDRQILIEALRFNRQILATPPMLELQPAQFVPPINADDDALSQVINNGIRTEFHPSGTLAMLPLEQGGVVDPHLRVWGTQNLRVVDAGIFPMIPAAHLQAVVYGVAEKAADIIKSDNFAANLIEIASSSSISTSASISSSSSLASSTLSTDSLTQTLSSMLGTTSSTFGSSSVIASSSATSTYPTSIQTSLSAVSSSLISIAEVLLPPTVSSAMSVLSEESASPSAAALPSSTLVSGEPITVTAYFSGQSTSASTEMVLISETSLSTPVLGGATAPLVSTTEVPLTTNQLSPTSGPSNLGLAPSSPVSIPPQSVLVFTTTLPSIVPIILSSIETQLVTGSPISGQTTSTALPISTPTAAEAAAEASIVAALTAAGIPPSAAQSLEAIIFGEFQGSNQTESSTTIDQQKNNAAIQAIVRWVVSFLHQ